MQQGVVNRLEAGELVGLRGIVRRLSGAAKPAISICTLVKDPSEYEAFRSSFQTGGFDDGRCEFLIVDNSRENIADAYEAVNEFLQCASAEFVMLVHQDVRLIEHGMEELLARLRELTAVDPNWGVCGNAGHTAEGWAAICISHPYGHDVEGPFPARVVSLDENFIVARKLANVAVSRDLVGFHHYGPDICIIADVLGWNAYVIDFYLQHNGRGTFDRKYAASREAIAAKYARAFRSRWVHLITREPFFVSGSANARRFAPLVRRVRKALGLTPRIRDLNERARRAAAKLPKP